MRRLTMMAIAALLAAPMVFAQDWAKAQVEKSPRHRETITVKHGDRSVEAFVVYPDAKGKTPVIVVIHEIFGLSEWSQEVADEFAAAGYIAIAPDLLSGMGPNGGGTKSFTGGQTEIGAAIGKLPPEQITADLNAVADYALKLPSSNGKLYSTGFCWGGGQTFRFATNRDDLQAVFSFYGPPPQAADMARIKANVYGFYAGQDSRIGAMIPKGTDDMKAAGKFYEPVTYDGAQHGFMRLGEDPTNTNDANKAAREKAWAKIKEVTAKGK
jgi:carboxymethylenebutenolidase